MHLNVIIKSNKNVTAFLLQQFTNRIKANVDFKLKRLT